MFCCKKKAYRKLRIHANVFLSFCTVYTWKHVSSDLPSYLGYSRIGPISNFWFQRLSRLKFFSLLFSLFCEANLFSFLNTCCYGNPFIRRSGNTSPSHFNFGCLQFLKQKLKEQLQRTRQTERNKESRTLGLEAIAE